MAQVQLCHSWLFKYHGIRDRTSRKSPCAPAQVDPEIFAIIKQDGVESLADVVGLFTDRDYEEGLKDYPERSANHEGSKIQLSRLRIAWMVAKRDLQATKPLEDGDLEPPRSHSGKKQNFALDMRSLRPLRFSIGCTENLGSSRRA